MPLLSRPGQGSTAWQTAVPSEPGAHCACWWAAGTVCPFQLCPSVPFSAGATQTSVFSEPSARHAGLVGSWLGTEQLVISARSNSRVGLLPVSVLPAMSVHMPSLQDAKKDM